MTDHKPKPGAPEGKADDQRQLNPAAERALAEAAARRTALAGHPSDRPKEKGGPEGPEPTRYGDWDINGLTSDF